MQLSNGHSSVYSADNSSYGSTITSSSLYGSQQRSAFTQPLIGMPNLANWPAMPSTTHLLPTTSSLSIVHPTRPSSHNVPPIHSPLTAQVYSTDTLRTQTALDVTDGTYSYQQQHSPDSQILPECASSEPSSKHCCSCVKQSSYLLLAFLWKASNLVCTFVASALCLLLFLKNILDHFNFFIGWFLN